ERPLLRDAPARTPGGEDKGLKSQQVNQRKSCSGGEPVAKMRIQAFAGLHEYVAEKNGYFQQEGLNYEIVRNAGGMQRMTEAPTAPLTEAQRAAAPDRA